MENIAFSMDNVAQVAVAPINADHTISTGGGNTLTFAGLVVSQKGQPFEVISVTSDNWLSKLGKPYHSSVGKFADSMRSLDEALQGGNGLVVRVVPTAATYPAIAFADVDGTLTPTNEAVAYGTALALSGDNVLAIAIKDGADSDSRRLTITPADEAAYGAGMFMLELAELNSAGGYTVLEESIVSFDPLAIDQMGVSAYIETVLDKSGYLTCLVGAGAKAAFATWAATATPEPVVASFTGASNGDISAITPEDYLKAVEVLKATVQSFNYVCGLSCYDEGAIKELAGICTAKRISGYFDIDPRLSHAEALAAKQTLGINNSRASFVHIPYSAKCRFYGNAALWGGSGVGFKAKALGVAKAVPVGGWHYAPAGTERASIPRTGLAPIAGAGVANNQAQYKARLNKLAVDENGNLFIDDSLTSYAAENYLRFEQVVSIADAISRRFYALGNRLKHQPDGTTLEGLTDGMTTIFSDFEAVGALVTPRDKAAGDEPWTFTIEQVEIDYWKVTWSFCPAGSARRIHGEPILLR